MNAWLALTVIVATGMIAGIVRVVAVRAARRRRQRVVEKPNSFYTPKLVLDRDARHRWHNIPLDRMHEINRGEVRRLLEKLEALGVDGMTHRERAFLDRMAELNPPRVIPDSTLSDAAADAFWSDPFGFERRLGTRDANR